jgi:LmbE family N-acetylglucosaminyl deacetylase
MNYLIVVAHPDDEVLGAGATIFKLSSEGHQIDVCIMSGNVEARKNRPDLNELDQDVQSSLDILGVRNTIKGGFPNIKFNNVNHLELVQFIEKAIVDSGADIVITHHPADTNNDHLHTSIATQAAIRLFQRNPKIKPIKELLFMEVPSSTEWSVNKAMNLFNPNLFIEVGKEAVEKKVHALSLYRGVMRPYPHPRSNEFIKGLAAYRGGQSGTYYAEAFESVFRRGF